MRLAKLIVIAFICLAVSACSALPAAVRGDFSDSPGLAAVQSSGDSLNGREVRWGGRVVGVQNRAAETRMEIASQPLDSDARPTGKSNGRFLAVFSGFLDPAVYGVGRELTVVGRVERVVEQKIGDFPYHFPVVRVERQYFWPLPRPLYERYYWRDPWFDPWYPFVYPPFYSPWY